MEGKWPAPFLNDVQGFLGISLADVGICLGVSYGWIFFWDDAVFAPYGFFLFFIGIFGFMPLRYRFRRKMLRTVLIYALTSSVILKPRK